MNIYLLGKNSFIGKNYYLKLKENFESENLICLSHDNIKELKNITSNDIIINFCGINRGATEEDFINGNLNFIKNILYYLKEVYPYLIHISSLMVYGFKNKNLFDLPNYQRYFINSKLLAENHLINNYPKNKLCIIRPSNIFGFDCEPYYNNILVTLIHEKIKKEYKINKINKNCLRNFLSIDGLIIEIFDIMIEKKIGNFNIKSNNEIGLDKLINILYKYKLPESIQIIHDEESIIECENEKIDGINIIVNENLENKIKETENKIINISK